MSFAIIVTTDAKPSREALESVLEHSGVRDCLGEALNADISLKLGLTGQTIVPDDPEFDGTPLAHPAWQRGHDQGVEGTARRIMDVLEGKDSGSGVIASPLLESVRRRVLGLMRGEEEMLAVINSPDPVLLFLEMASKDCGLEGEHPAPSNLDMLAFDSEEEAERVEKALSEYVSDKYPDHAHLWWFFSRNHPTLGDLEKAKALVDEMMNEQFGQPCNCELPGDWRSGVPGILARVENSKLVPGTKVERCDECQRYESDEAALAKLVELGISPAGYRKFEVTVESRRKLIEDTWAASPEQAKQIVDERTAEGDMDWNDAETLHLTVTDAQEVQPE